MIPKHPISTERLRKIPPHFSWVDHRLVRDRHIDRLSPGAAALYLFLVTVSDSLGLSHYGDPSIMARLSMEEGDLSAARHNLLDTGLIAHRSPLHQVLSLEPLAPKVRVRHQEPESVSDIFREFLRRFA